jgi:hypothetical protein
MTSARVRRILRRQGMPPEELRAVFGSGDPQVVSRVLELHRERLGEWFDEERRLVAAIERSLVRGSTSVPSDGDPRCAATTA